MILEFLFRLAYTSQEKIKCQSLYGYLIYTMDHHGAGIYPEVLTLDVQSSNHNKPKLFVNCEATPSYTWGDMLLFFQLLNS